MSIEWSNLVWGICFIIYVIVMVGLLWEEWKIQKKLSKGKNENEAEVIKKVIDRLGIFIYPMPTGFVFMASLVLFKSLLIAIIVTIIHTLIMIVLFESFRRIFSHEGKLKDIDKKRVI